MLASWSEIEPFRLLGSVLGPLEAGTVRFFLPDQKDDPEPPRLPDPRRAALMGLLVTILLVVVGVLLVRVLGRAARMQDCVMSGRTNCAPIDAPMTSSR
jgi:hypothetical protein